MRQYLSRLWLLPSRRNRKCGHCGSYCFLQWCSDPDTLTFFWRDDFFLANTGHPHDYSWYYLVCRQPTQHQGKRSGVLYAVIATLGYGLGLWVIGSQLRGYLDGDILSWLLMATQLIWWWLSTNQKNSLSLQGLGIVSLTGGVGVLGYVVLTIALGNQQNGLVAVVGFYTD